MEIEQRESVSIKAAFTLAEVLITLGIIGVVAAMTLPAVINKIQHKQLETAFKKSYSVISQAIQRIAQEEGEIPTAYSLAGIKSADLVKKYFSVSESCIIASNGMSNSSCMGRGGFNTWFYSFYSKTYNKKTVANNLHSWFDDGMFILSDGKIIFLDKSHGDNLLVGVDTNGKKAPNLLGHDLFLFKLNYQTGALVGYDLGMDSIEDENTYCSKTSNDGLNGLSCSVEALKNPGEYFKNLP